MIFSLAQLHSDSLFNGNAIDPLDWSSRLPELSVLGLGADPALTNDLWGAGQVAQLGMRNVATALRLSMGQVATTLGFDATQLVSVKRAYTDPLEALTGGIDLARRILGSPLFSVAIDGLGWIPVAGWIVDIVADVVQLVSSVVTAIRDKRHAKAMERLAQIGTLPLAQWSQGADEALTRTMMLRLRDYDAQWLVSPRYPATSPADFRATPQTIEGTPKPPWASWLLHTGHVDDLGGSAGLGFVPGTRNLHGALELRTQHGQDLRDVGDFYPTARMAAVQWWEMAVAGGPAAFSVDADEAQSAWADYIGAASEFAESILGGWSTSVTASKVGATTHTCTDLLYGIGDCTSAKRGKSVAVVGTGHRAAYKRYLQTLFDLRRRDPSAPWSPSNIDTYDTIPGRALSNLRDRQDALLQSLACMTVDDSDVGGIPRFRAIGTPDHKGPMWRRWHDSVVAVFQSDAWRTVQFDDVPAGRLKDELRERCISAGVDCRELGKQFQNSFAAPSALANPVPPTPPNPVEVQIAHLVPGALQPKKKRPTKVAAMVLAAGVLGGLWHLSK